MAGDAVSVGEPPYEGLVAVAVARTEVEVAVGNGEGDACPMEKMGHADRIATTANGKQHLLPRGEEVLLTNIVYEPPKHQRRIIFFMRRCPSTTMP